MSEVKHQQLKILSQFSSENQVKFKKKNVYKIRI